MYLRDANPLLVEEHLRPVRFKRVEPIDTTLWAVIFEKWPSQMDFEILRRTEYIALIANGSGEIGDVIGGECWVYFYIEAEGKMLAENF